MQYTRGDANACMRPSYVDYFETAAGIPGSDIRVNRDSRQASLSEHTHRTKIHSVNTTP